MYFLGTPIGFIMNFIYDFIGNYGLSIILLSTFVKLCTLPLTLKQQKSMAAMQQVQPLMTEIQNKYKNDKEKQSTEMMKLYKQYNISPMSGCLPMLIQFPILFGLYAAVAKPLTYMLRLSAEQITAIAQALNFNMPANSFTAEMSLAQQMSLPENIANIQALVPNVHAIDFNFLGLNLAQTPTYTVPALIWILPLLSAGLSFLSSYIMQPKQKNNDDNPMASTTKMMTYFMPLMILWIGFSVPAGLSLYWVVNSALQILQYLTIDRKAKMKIATEIAASSVATEAVKKKKRR